MKLVEQESHDKSHPTLSGYCLNSFRHNDLTTYLSKALNRMRIMYWSTEIIKGKNSLPQSHSLYIIMVWVSYHCPGEMRISVPRQYPMSWSENDIEMRV